MAATITKPIPDVEQGYETTQYLLYSNNRIYRSSTGPDGGRTGPTGSSGAASAAKLAAEIIVPDSGASVVASVDDASLCTPNTHIYIPGTGFLWVKSVDTSNNTVTVLNDGLAPAAQTVPAETSFISTAQGPTGPKGENAYTFTTAEFTVPAENASVAVPVLDTVLFNAGGHIFLPGYGYFEINSIDRNQNLLTIIPETLTTEGAIAPANTPIVNVGICATGPTGVGVAGLTGDNKGVITVTLTNNDTYTVYAPTGPQGPTGPFQIDRPYMSLYANNTNETITFNGAVTPITVTTNPQSSFYEFDYTNGEITVTRGGTYRYSLSFASTSNYSLLTPDVDEADPARLIVSTNGTEVSATTLLPQYAHFSVYREGYVTVADGDIITFSSAGRLVPGDVEELNIKYFEISLSMA